MSKESDKINQAFCKCRRCGASCKVDPKPNSQARMLKRSAKPKGLCVNCAVQNELRHLYPANLLLARSGPSCLALLHIQEQFAGILKLAGSDAEPDEIDWDVIIENWELPFSHKVKPSATNPVTQEELDREKTRQDDQASFLTEQERRAKSVADRDHALRNLGEVLHPGKVVHIHDDGQGMIDMIIDQ